MNLLNAPALLYLLTIPPVVLLYFLRLRRKDRVVPSTLLWESSTADLQANSPFQKLRNNLRLEVVEYHLGERSPAFRCVLEAGCNRH